MGHKKLTSPPKWPLRLLRFFVKPEYLEEIEGDMEEVFIDDLDSYPPGKARRKYCWGVLKLLRPSLIKNIISTQKFNYQGMLHHNFLLTLRSFKRYKSTFLINLIGLSTGLTATIFIFLWVNDELDVNTFHEKNDRLYWAMTHFNLTNGIVTWDYTSGQLAQALKEEMPEVEDAVRVGNNFHTPRGVVSLDDNHFKVEGLFAGDNFFNMMSYPLLAGNKTSVINTLGKIAISEKMALKMFDSIEGSLGKIIEWDNELFNKTFEITGVFKDVPANATEQFDVVINYDVLIEADKYAGEWNGGYAETYLILKEGTDVNAFNKKIADYLDDKVTTDEFTLFVQKYADRYLYGQYNEGQLVGGRIEYVRLFIVIAIFILVIACINFMNLSTAQASRKMKEIGVKKAIGASRRSLIFQFLTESVLMAILSLGIAILIVALLLPKFNLITDKHLTLNLGHHFYSITGIVLLTGLIAGSYPAFFLSGFKPVSVLKGKSTGSTNAEWIRKGLVILQFTLSIIFIIGFIVLNRQIEYTQTKNLGYNRDNILKFVSRGQKAVDPDIFKANLSTIPGVVSIGNMAGDFLWGNDNGSGYRWGDDPTNRNHLFLSPKIGFGVAETLDLEIVEGRNFLKDFNDNHHRIILNESAVAMMGLENPVGTILDYGDSQQKAIIGVVKDFQYGSMHQEIEPMILRFRNWGRDYLIKIKSGTEMSTIAQIEKVYKQFHPSYNFEPTFLDDDYEALYKSEMRVATIANFMAFISIIISCLGLFGLANFTAERRLKEIGIRKILGASAGNILYLLTSNFTKTVLISVVLAMPIGYFLAGEWLTNFAYSIQLKWWFFALAGLSALVISWLTVGIQSFKTANVNPVECIKDE